MAVPVITGLDRTEGSPIGGYLLVISGSDFELPMDMLTLPPPLPIPLPAPPQTVRVLFENATYGVSIEAPVVEVASSTEVHVIVPKLILPLDGQDVVDSLVMDIRLQHIDASGTIIPGEEVVLAGGYTFIHEDTSSATFRKIPTVTQHLIALLRSEVIPNVSSVPHTEWDRHLETLWVDQAELPQLVLLGPTMVRADGSRQDNSEVEVPGTTPNTYTSYRSPVYYDLTYTILGLTDHTQQLQNIQDLLTVVVDKNAVIYPPINIHDLSMGFDEYDMEWVIPPSVEELTGQYNSNIRFFRGTLRVEAVGLAEVITCTQDATRNMDGVVQELVLQLTQLIPDDC